jgi:hypothetical protein
MLTLPGHIVSEISLGGSRQRAIYRRDIWDKNVVGAQFHTSATNMSSSEEDIVVAYWFSYKYELK